MEKDYISYNGALIRESDIDMNIVGLLSANYLYQRIHVSAFKPLHLSEHINILSRSYGYLYGSELNIDEASLSSSVRSLLLENKYQPADHSVMLYVMPPSDDASSYNLLLAVNHQMLYRGYQLWHSASRALILPYQPLFAEHHTSISLKSHNYAGEYARLRGFDIPLCLTDSGYVVSAGEHPIFIFRGKDIITPSLEGDTPNSVVRRVIIKAVEELDYDLAEERITEEDIAACDELFYATPQGPVSIRECKGKQFPNTAARMIAQAMNTVSL